MGMQYCCRQVGIGNMGALTTWGALSVEAGRSNLQLRGCEFLTLSGSDFRQVVDTLSPSV